MRACSDCALGCCHCHFILF
uniref:Uncharacterized protein n=1 Tax=Anguilla anguilla TaxID=7936 RepID=A0A0E9QWN9_ANGAN